MTLYLSRLNLPRRDRCAQRLLGDCHALHRFVMSGFPDVAARDARNELGVLYRVEPRSHDDPCVHVLVQSNEAPRWAFESPGYTAEPPRPLDALAAAIGAGRRFRFRLLANPTRRVSRRATEEADPARGRDRPEDPKSVGMRVGVRSEEARLAWLKRKGEAAGFQLLAATISGGIEDPRQSSFDVARADPAAALAGVRQQDRTRDQLTFETCLFEGILEVTSADALRAALRDGIGPGKAFGCGLLSLAEVRSP